MCIIGTSSCTGEIDFKSSEDALSKYQFYMNSLKDKKTCTTEQLSDDICQWQELSDSVYSYLKIHDELNVHGREEAFTSLSDSIRHILINLSGFQNRNFSDVITIKETTNPYRNDHAVDSLKKVCASFFDELDKASLKEGDKNAAITEYRQYISFVSNSGIHSEEEFFRFLKFEDFLFRRFLMHLHDVNDGSMSQITADTDSICSQIFQASNDGELDDTEVMAYMTLRTNRRLIQNSKVCFDALNNGKMDRNQTVAFIWMTVQPFVAMDPLSVAFLSDEQKSTLHEIADGLPAVAEHLSFKDASIDQLIDRLPTKILKLYISSL